MWSKFPVMWIGKSQLWIGKSQRWIGKVCASLQNQLLRQLQTGEAAAKIPPIDTKWYFLPLPLKWRHRN